MIDLQKRKKPPWFPRAASPRTISSSRLAAPPIARLEPLGRILTRHRTGGCPQGSVRRMLTAEQTSAARRKRGAPRFPFVNAHDQHDFAKVNLRLRSVKIF